MDYLKHMHLLWAGVTHPKCRVCDNSLAPFQALKMQLAPHPFISIMNFFLKRKNYFLIT